MAFTAVPRPFHQVGAAVPLLGLLRVRLEAFVIEKQQVPQGDAPALVERKADVVLPVRLVHRFQAEQVGLDGEDVLARHQGVGGVRKGRVVVAAIRADALLHGLDELIVGPVADAGFLVRRDVGRVQRAERHLHRQAAGVGLAAFGDVAGQAVRGAGEVFAAFEQGVVRLLRHGRRAEQGQGSAQQAAGCESIVHAGTPQIT